MSCSHLQSHLAMCTTGLLQQNDFTKTKNLNSYMLANIQPIYLFCYSLCHQTARPSYLMLQCILQRKWPTASHWRKTIGVQYYCFAPYLLGEIWFKSRQIDDTKRGNAYRDMTPLRYLCSKPILELKTSQYFGLSSTNSLL